MTNPLIWADSKILALFTEFSHPFQRLTGSTNYFLAKLALAVVFIDQCFEIWNYFSKVSRPPERPWQLLVSSLLIISAIIGSTFCDACEHATKEKGHEGTLPAILEYFLSPALRMVYVILAVWATWLALPIKAHARPEILRDMLGHCFSWGLVAFCYFMAVTPLPRSRSKIRQWIIEILHAKIESAKPIPISTPK